MQCRALAMAAAGLILIAGSGCGGGGDSNTPTAPSPSPTTATIAITGNAGAQSFAPNPAPVGGRNVVFTNNDGVVHRIVLNDGSLATGDIAPGATSTALLMPVAGTNYHCSIHPTMVGAVSPRAGEPAPPCTGQYC